MKKILIITNIMTLTIIYLNSCGVAITTTSHNSIIHKSSRLMAINYSNNPFRGIDVGLAHYMVDEFKKSFNDKNEASRSVWFNLDTLKKFIWHIEDESAKRGLNSAQLEKLGLRIYYGIYPPSNTWSSTYSDMVGVNENFEKKHTVFMIPTYFNGTYNKEFDPTKFSSRRPLSLNELLATDSASLFSLGATGPDVDLQNHGDLIPPMNGNYRGADFMQFADTH